MTQKYYSINNINTSMTSHGFCRVQCTAVYDTIVSSTHLCTAYDSCAHLLVSIPKLECILAYIYIYVLVLQISVGRAMENECVRFMGSSSALSRLPARIQMWFRSVANAPPRAPRRCQCAKHVWENHRARRRGWGVSTSSRGFTPTRSVLDVRRRLRIWNPQLSPPVRSPRSTRPALPFARSFLTFVAFLALPNPLLVDPVCGTRVISALTLME